MTKLSKAQWENQSMGTPWFELPNDTKEQGDQEMRKIEPGISYDWVKVGNTCIDENQHFGTITKVVGTGMDARVTYTDWKDDSTHTNSAWKMGEGINGAEFKKGFETIQKDQAARHQTTILGLDKDGYGGRWN
jgi:hypothetical protein